MCGYEKDAKHALGKRFFYKWTKGYGQYIVYYAQKCTVCQQKLEGKVYYWDGYWFDWWSDTEKFLNKLIEEGYVDESWMVSTGWKFGLWGVQTSYKVADFLWKALSVIQGTQGVYDPGHVVIVSTPVLSASDSDTPFEKQDHPIMDKIDLTSARITADYDKLLKPGGDVECVAAWKDSAGAIEAAKAKKKETPDSNGAKGGAVFEVQEKGGADQDGGGSTPAEEKEYELGDDWENAEEPVRMLKDSAAIDGLTPMDDYEFDLTRTGAQSANASGHVEYATFPINPDFYKSLDAGPHTITVWVAGVDRDTGEPVSYTIDKEIQIVELGGEKLATEPLYKNGYATMSVSPESGACTGQAHTPAVTLKTPAETLVEGKDYELCYFRVVDGKTMIPVKEIRPPASI